jgi:hypothetical protein
MAIARLDQGARLPHKSRSGAAFLSGGGNKTGTNRRRAKRIRFSGKKRVESRRAPHLIKANAVG